MSFSFPNESREYRAARNQLLRREAGLRGEMESIAVELRSLPPGGEIPEDYVFDRRNVEGVSAHVRMSTFSGASTR